jgi:hypothetical protein
VTFEQSIKSVFAGVALALASGTLNNPDWASVTPKHFDLICTTYSRFVYEKHPDNQDVWNMPTNSGRGIDRFAVDLTKGRMQNITAVQFCAKNICNAIQLSDYIDIEKVTKNYILLSTHRFRKFSIRRTDGWLESHYVVSAYRTQLTTGTCKLAPFSGFSVLKRLK